VLPLAGLRFQVDSQPVARMGIASDAKDSASGGVRISQVVPGGAMEEAGLKVGDIVLRVADIPVSDPNAYGPAFRQKMAGQPEGTGYDVVVARDGQQLTLHAKLRFLPNVAYSVSEDPNASEKAVRIREGILKGTSR
jgi:S1-C subfamily serine protease